MTVIDAWFDQMEDWKRLPAYKVENRIDAIVGFALPEILRRAAGIEVRQCIPEFPLRRGTIFPHEEGSRTQNLSKKVDFYIQTNEGAHWFVEFKSDSASRNARQDDYLHAARVAGMEAIVAGVFRLREKTKARRKYAHLLGKLEAMGLVRGDRPIVTEDEIRLLYIQPRLVSREDPPMTITFPRVAEALDHAYPGDAFMNRFAQSLRRWADD